MSTSQALGSPSQPTLPSGDKQAQDHQHELPSDNSAHANTAAHSIPRVVARAPIIPYDAILRAPPSHVPGEAYINATAANLIPPAATAGRALQPPPFIAYPLHGPLQAERIAREEAAAAREQQKKDEKARKEAEKEAKKRLRDEQAAAKLAAKKEKEIERAAKEAQKQAAKQAKQAKQAATKSNRRRGPRPPGGSDDEIELADPREIEAATIKPIVKHERTRNWTDEEAVRAVGHIVSVWRHFKLKRPAIFKHISEYVLLGSKDPKQVANYWANCWKKFKACRRRQSHTGGGDGDELEADATREEVNSTEWDTSDDEAKPVVKKERNDVGDSAFSDAQLDRFEESEVYTLILKVARKNPEVVKIEEFDSARPLSDSDTETPPKLRRQRAEDSADAELAQKTFDVIRASITSFGEVRRANLELANRREAREEREEGERRESRVEEQMILKRRIQLDEDAQKLALDREARRLELEARRLHLEERERRMREWDKVTAWLTSDNAILKAQGERLAKRLQVEEDREWGA